MNMNRKRWQGALVVLLSLVIVACATRPAPNFRGRWKPVNQLADAPVAIPLNTSYIYAPAPLDRTLKSMLTRWARDSRMTLSYLHGSDFTLYGPVADISTPSLQQAVSQLNAAYGSQGVAISADATQITVRQAGAAPPPAAP